MPNTNNQRPGVYSNYTVSSSYATPRSSLHAAVVCKGSVELSGTLYSLTSAAGAAELLGGAENLCALTCCRILLESGVSKIWVSVAANGDFESALSLLEELEGIGAVICDAADISGLKHLRDSVHRSSSKLYERVAYCGISATGTAMAIAAELSDERVVICCPTATASGNMPPLPVYGAASLAGYLLARDDPAANLNGAELKTLSAVSKLPESDIQSLIAGGVTVLEEVGAHVECVRAVTTRAQSGGAPDNTLRPLNTILIIDDVMRTLRQSLKARLGGLRRHSGTLDAILSQVMVELAAKEDEGVIESFEAPGVRADENDPSVCIVEISFTAAHLVDQIHITAHVEV